MKLSCWRQNEVSREYNLLLGRLYWGSLATLGASLLGLLLAIGCQKQDLSEPAKGLVQGERIAVAVVTPPYRWLVKEVAGDRAEGIVIFSGSTCAETFQPADLEVSRIMSCRLLIRAGLPFENSPWFKNLLASGRFRVLDMRECLEEAAQLARRASLAEDGEDPRTSGEECQYKSAGGHHSCADEESPHPHPSGNMGLADTADGAVAGDHQRNIAADKGASPGADAARLQADSGGGASLTTFGKAGESSSASGDIESPESRHDDHECQDHHHHADGVDPHLWLSVRLLREQARILAGILAELDPAGRREYEENLSRFQGRLGGLARKLQERLAEARGRRFLVFHPAWGHFAADFGLQQVAVEKEGKLPSDTELSDLQRQLREAGVRAMVVESPDPHHPARRLAEMLGLEAVCIVPTEENVEETLVQLAEFVVKFGY